jgi:hypothetical protein
MITIRRLKEELNKFDDDCVCFAYEGEVTGLVIEKAGSDKQRVVYCSEGDDTGKETETIS